MSVPEQVKTIIAEERFETAWPDMQALLEQHWRELSNFPDIPLQVDEADYRQLAQAKKLCLITARTEGNHLVGYVVFLVSHNRHYATSRQAVQDVFYVDPAFRNHGLGRDLIDGAERTLRARGVQVVYHHVKLSHPALGHLLAKCGYARVETIFARRLDQEDVE